LKRIAMMTLALASMVVFATGAVSATTINAAKAGSARATQLAKATARFRQAEKAGYHEPLCQSHVALVPTPIPTSRTSTSATTSRR
jgi:hypothetical protein